MIKHSLIFALIITFILTSGCASIIDATFQEPIQLDTGTRTLGTVLDDEKLETVALVNIRKGHPALKAAHINVVSFNGVILLTGEVSSGQLRDQAGSIVRDIHLVRQVFNEIQVQGKTSILSRTNDTWLTSKVKRVIKKF